jgi:outer membrane lipoprotein-sorting protein
MLNTVLSLTLVTIGLFMAMIVPALADIKTDILVELRNHYSKVPTMQGEFLQFGPDGDQTGGTFAIKRPGMVRFDYEEPSPVEVVSNGLAVMVVNNKLKTFNTYPLKSTPLKLLLDDQFDIDPESILEVTKDEDVTRVVLGDKKLFGSSVITLLFEPQTFELRQWTIKDAQGKETSVMVFNVEDNVELSNRLFQINKSQYQRRN